MHRIIVFIFLLAICLTACSKRQRKGAFQGVWYRQGYNTEAFAVRGDSMYFPNLKKGYHFNFDKDTLVINFTETQVRSQLQSFSSQRIKAINLKGRKDTILLFRSPSMVDSLAY